jgi:hypothetical protein
VAGGDIHTVEDQTLDMQELGLSRSSHHPQQKTGAPTGACFVSA